jgi:hypothetical protein
MDGREHPAGFDDLPAVVDGEKIALENRKDSDEEPPARQRQPGPQPARRVVAELDQQTAVSRRDGSRHRYRLGVEPRHHACGVLEV